MNPCLANPVDDEVLPDPDAPVAGDGVDSPAAVPEAGEACVPEVTGAAPVATGRVLLVDDDPAFNEVTRDYLTECGYTVVAVTSGADGVREVLAHDFVLIFCDLSMPTMPGDMFYRAVERSRPQLCKRFVFMSGYREDARTNEFIQQVGGYLLRKPFPLQHLVDSIAFTEVRNTYHSVFETAPRGPANSRTGPPVEAQIGSAALLPPLPALEPQPPEPVPLAPPLQAEPPPHRPTIAVPQSVPQLVPQVIPQGRRRLVSLAWTVAGAVLLLGLFAILASQYRLVRDRAAVRSAELLALEKQWTGASAHLAEGEGKRRGMEARVNRAKILAAESKAPGLAQVLGSVATAATAQTELREVEVRADPEDPAALHLRVTGVGTGREPRATADRFRQTLELNLQRSFAEAGVTTRFERLEDASPSLDESANPQKRQAAFTIIATIGKGGK